MTPEELLERLRQPHWLLRVHVGLEYVLDQEEATLVEQQLDRISQWDGTEGTKPRWVALTDIAGKSVRVRYRDLKDLRQSSDELLRLEYVKYSYDDQIRREAEKVVRPEGWVDDVDC